MKGERHRLSGLSFQLPIIIYVYLVGFGNKNSNGTREYYSFSGFNVELGFHENSSCPCFCSFDWLYLSMCTGASFSLCLYPYLPYYSNISSRFGNLSHTINGKGKTHVYIENFEDIKGVIRIRKSEDRQHNDQDKQFLLHQWHPSCNVPYNATIKFHELDFFLSRISVKLFRFQNEYLYYIF